MVRTEGPQHDALGSAEAGAAPIEASTACLQDGACRPLRGQDNLHREGAEPAFARPPVLPEATSVGLLSALLRHSRLGIPGEPSVDNGDIFYSLCITRSWPQGSCMRRQGDGVRPKPVPLHRGQKAAMRSNERQNAHARRHVAGR